MSDFIEHHQVLMFFFGIVTTGKIVTAPRPELTCWKRHMVLVCSSELQNTTRIEPAKCFRATRYRFKWSPAAKSEVTSPWLCWESIWPLWIIWDQQNSEYLWMDVLANYQEISWKWTQREVRMLTLWTLTAWVWLMESAAWRILQATASTRHNTLQSCWELNDLLILFLASLFDDCFVGNFKIMQWLFSH